MRSWLEKFKGNLVNGGGDAVDGWNGAAIDSKTSKAVSGQYHDLQFTGEGGGGSTDFSRRTERGVGKDSAPVQTNISH
jgi:hypothetical protein